MRRSLQAPKRRSDDAAIRRPAKVMACAGRKCLFVRYGRQVQLGPPKMPTQCRAVSESDAHI